jgi:hypothetical protein
MIWVVHPGSRIPDPDADFLPIPDPGVKKAPIPDPGSAALAAIGLRKTGAASDWLLIKRHCIGTKGLPGYKINWITYR